MKASSIRSSVGQWIGCLAMGLILGGAPVAWAQGILIAPDSGQSFPLPRPWPRPPVPRPVPPASYKIDQLSVQARIKDQVARVEVTQTFENTGSVQIEARFVFPLPYDGAVDRLTFMVDGREIEGKLLPADEARRIYEGYVRRNQDPALLEWVGTGMFQTSVFPLPPGAKRQVSLRYNQVLRKNRRMTDFLFPLSTAKYTSAPVSLVDFNIAIESSTSLKSIYSPSHAVDISRSSDNLARVSWKAENVVPDADFRLFFDTAEDAVGASILSYRPAGDEDGFFLLLASPAVKARNVQPVRKTVILVVDRSGSMNGKKIEQAKEAMRFVINNLREGDLFNLVAYDSGVESFAPELQRYDDGSRKAAMGFVESVYAGGSTNISEALKTSLNMIQDVKQPSFVIFLSDGRPTAGEVNESKIAAMARSTNPHRARIISLGVGFDVNSRLLDRLTHDHGGASEYVRPNEDIELFVSRMYSRISEPLMTDLKLEFAGDDSQQRAPGVNRFYPREVRDLFAGEQLVVVGRYRGPGDVEIRLQGRLGDEDRSFKYQGSFVKESPDQSFAFVEKLWAVRRIGEIIDELDLGGKNDELIQELVQLSTKHGVITPYTSYLADENERGGLASISRGRMLASEELRQLQETEGADAFGQRQLKQEFRLADRVASNSYSSGPPASAEGRGMGGMGSLSRFRGLSPAGASAGGGLGGGSGGGDAGGQSPPADPTVLSIGSNALYKRGAQWFAANASDVKLDGDDRTADIITLQRFTDDYFKLVAANSPDENRVLSVQKPGEELVIRLRGSVYHIK